MAPRREPSVEVFPPAAEGSDAAAGGRLKLLRKWRLDGGTTVGLALLVLAVAVPFNLNGYWVYLGNIALIYIVLTLGFNVILGWAGQLAITSAAFFGFGSLVAGLVSKHYALPVEVCLLAGTAAGTVLGAAFGALVVRLRRYYLAIATFSLLYILDYFYRNVPALTGGVSGFAVSPPRALVAGGAVLQQGWAEYFFALGLVIIVYAFMRWLQTSALGRSWVTLRQDERIAAALGISVYRSKLLAFTISAGVMSLAGAWFVFVLGSFLPDNFSLDEMLFDFLILVVGGLGSVNGAVLGSIFLVVMREYFRGVPGASEVLFGALLLLVALFLRRGLYGTLANWLRWLREPFA